MKKKLESLPQISDSAQVKVTEYGEVTEITHSQHRNSNANTIRLDKDHYMTASGEVRQYQRSGDRQRTSINRATTVLRGLIECNVTPYNSVFLTLTYADDVTDYNTVHTDCTAFLRRLKRKIKQPYRTITRYELTDKGRYHIHIIMTADARPALTPQELTKLWGHGYTSIEPITEPYGMSWYISKGMWGTPEQLANYPSGRQLFHASRGLKRPVVTHMTKLQAAECVQDMELDSVEAVEYTDDKTGFKNTITRYRYKD